ncbi:MAG TPA: hypothetical protein PK704_03740 [Saprospiraceae bacterium]|nr:hypothetical protein [Saprospiraceae bacterium]
MSMHVCGWNCRYSELVVVIWVWFRYTGNCVRVMDRSEHEVKRMA